jgi:large subunit ribosomal protein L6
MAKKDLHEKIAVPAGVNVTLQGSLISVKGSKGAIERKFNSPRVSMDVAGNEVNLSSLNASKADKAVLRSYRAHILNMIKGSSEGYTYKLKICSGHFPMTVVATGNKLQIKNFLGEKVPREVELKKGATVKVEGNIITIESTDKEIAGQVSADIEQATRRPGFDRRIFQDGIYITEKAGKAI